MAGEPIVLEHVLLPGKLVDGRNQGKPRSFRTKPPHNWVRSSGTIFSRTKAISSTLPMHLPPEAEQLVNNCAFTSRTNSASPAASLLNAGVRYDHYSTFGGTTNPRAAQIYRAADKTTLKLLYGNAFSAPDVYETISQTSGSFYDDNLKQAPPEHIQSLEARVEQGTGTILSAIRAVCIATELAI